MLTIGEKIKYLRQKSGMSQPELAELLGTRKQTISRIERNLTSVKSDYVYALCEIFSVDANTLFGTIIVTLQEK